VSSEHGLLRVEGLKTYFFTNEGAVKAVDGVDFSVARGRTLGVVGESGCGKSVTSLSIMRLLPRTGRVVGGRVMFEDRDLLRLSEAEMRAVRGNDVAMIFQEPMTSLNPVYTTGEQVMEAVKLHLHLSDHDARDRAIELFRLVGIPAAERRIDDYPHQLSGGMRQRVMIAMALSCNPDVLIADEPSTALDVTIQAQILELLRRLQQEQGMAIVLITHDLGVIAEMAQDVVVMYAGKIVERGNVEQIFDQPLHPYTQGLLTSIPGRGTRGKRLNVIKGTVPHPFNLPPGCTFAPRCPHAFQRCPTAYPAQMEHGDGHRVACYLYGDAAEPGTEGVPAEQASMVLAAERAQEAEA
jgi:peptide/nickel transport system ATP-binding protein/oligopeptide transport system ATP-binding protein